MSWSRLGNEIRGLAITSQAVRSGTRLFAGGQLSRDRRPALLRLGGPRLEAHVLAVPAPPGCTRVLSLCAPPGGQVLWVGLDGALGRYEQRSGRWNFTSTPAWDVVGLARDPTSGVVLRVPRADGIGWSVSDVTTLGWEFLRRSRPDEVPRGVLWADALGWFVYGSDKSGPIVWRLDKNLSVVQTARPPESEGIETCAFSCATWLPTPGWIDLGRAVFASRPDSSFWGWNNQEVMTYLGDVSGREVSQSAVWRGRAYWGMLSGQSRARYVRSSSLAPDDWEVDGRLPHPARGLIPSPDGKWLVALISSSVRPRQQSVAEVWVRGKWKNTN